MADRCHQFVRGRRRLRRRSLGLCAVGLVVVATGGGSSLASSAGSGATTADDLLAPQPLAERTTIDLAFSGPREDFLNLILPDLVGEYDRENIEVNYSYVPATESTLLLVQGEVDVAASSLGSGMFNLMAGGESIRVVATGKTSAPEVREGFWARQDILGDDGFQPRDLLDQEIGSAFGPASGIFGAFLRQANEIEPGVLTAQNLQHRVLQPGDAETALQNGAVNAAMSLPPFSLELIEDDCCEYIGLWPEYSPLAIYFGPRLLDEDREVGLALLRAVARTVRDYMQTDYHQDDELAPVIAEALDQPVDAFRASATPGWETLVPAEQFFTDSQGYFLELGEGLDYETPLTIEEVYDLWFVEQLGLTDS